MNKLVIPSILIGAVLIAGIFAFAPVQKASTVHDQIIAALTAQTQGANLVRLAIPIDNIETDGNGGTTWTQIVTFDRISGEGAWEIEKLFLCDVFNQNPRLEIGFDVETLIVGDSKTEGKPSLVDHTPANNPRFMELIAIDYEGECVDIKLASAIHGGENTHRGWTQVMLGGDRDNNVNVRLHDQSCDSTVDEDGAVLVAYIIGLEDASQMETDPGVAVTKLDDCGGD